MLTLAGMSRDVTCMILFVLTAAALQPSTAAKGIPKNDSHGAGRVCPAEPMHQLLNYAEDIKPK